MSKYRRVLVAVFIIAVGATGYFGWQARIALQTKPLPLVTPEPVPVAAPLVVPPAPQASAPAEPVIKYPVHAIAPPDDKLKQPFPALAESDGYVKQALLSLLGKKHVQTFLQLDGFVRRVVVTIDNLAREHAAPSLWPVNQTPGRFTTLVPTGYTGEVISPDNSQRYVPLVLFIESLNLKQTVSLYVSLYPLFQQAYEELGYPNGYFNDRLVAVIDHLLSTPEQARPTGVILVEVKGPIPSKRPWLRYEFADPKLEALSAGQKILIRTGPVNHRRLHRKLQEIRGLLVGAALAAPAAKASQ